MSKLSPLLVVQELDLASDALMERRWTLPERAERAQIEVRQAELDRAHADLEQTRKTLNAAEHALADEAAAIAAKAKEVEANLYSGSVTVPKELAGLQEEVRLLKEKQASIEDRELELMEEIERTEGEIAGNRAQRAECDARDRELASAVATAESQIDAELTGLADSRAKAAPDIPAEILAKYDELRGKAGLAGRAAAQLEKGTCQGCRVKLAVMDHRRIQEEPELALVRCTHCKRILVR